MEKVILKNILKQIKYILSSELCMFLIERNMYKLIVLTENRMNETGLMSDGMKLFGLMD